MWGVRVLVVSLILMVARLVWVLADPSAGSRLLAVTLSLVLAVVLAAEMRRVPNT